MDILRNIKSEVLEENPDETEYSDQKFSISSVNSLQVAKVSTNHKSVFINTSKRKSKKPVAIKNKSEISVKETHFLANKEPVPKVPIFRYRSVNFSAIPTIRFHPIHPSLKNNIVSDKNSKNISKPYPCGVCSENFKYRDELLLHLQMHTEKIPIQQLNKKSQAVVKIFPCKICGRTFASTSDFRYHHCPKPKALLEVLVKCLYCSKDVKKSGLAMHMRKSHIDKNPYPCAQCDAGFKSKKRLREHVDIQHGNFFACEFCEKRFRKSEKLKKHMLTHEKQDSHTAEKDAAKAPVPETLVSPPQKRVEMLILPINLPQPVPESHRNPLMCRICSASFTEEQTFQQHLQTHSVDNFIHCKKCGLLFQDGADYRVHSKSHVKLLPCRVCGKSFIKSELQDHMKVHEDLFAATKKRQFHAVVKIVHCEFCEKTFGLERDLTKHHETVHKDIKRYPCELCPSGFMRHFDLITHIKRRHLKEKPEYLNLNIPCEACGKRFTNKTSLRRHLKIHNDERRFSCDFCKKRFLTFHARQVHLRVHTREKPFTCDICQKSFGYNNTFRDHMKTHSKDKLSCDLCKRIFTRKIHWLNHIRKCSELNTQSARS